MRPARSFELYPETVGGPELIGSFTVYNREVYDGLQLEHIAELCRINTAPLPSCVLLMPASSSLGDEAAVVGTARGHDDLSMTETATVKRARLGGSIPMMSVTAGVLPSLIMGKQATGLASRAITLCKTVGTGVVLTCALAATR